MNPSLCDKLWLYYNGRLYCTRLTTSSCTVYVLTFYAKGNVHQMSNIGCVEPQYNNTWQNVDACKSYHVNIFTGICNLCETALVVGQIAADTVWIVWI